MSAQSGALDTRHGCQAERLEVGSVTNDHLGQTLSTGDWNGDGITDVLSGGLTTRKAFLYLGDSPSGAPCVHHATLQGDDCDGETDEAGDRFGWAIANVGDVNGDGYEDVAVSAPRGAMRETLQFNFPAAQDGRGYANLFLGGPDDDPQDVYPLFPGFAGLLAPGEGEQADLFGHALAGGVDITGDTLPDILVGCPLYSVDLNKQGAVYAYRWDSTTQAIAPAFEEQQPITLRTTRLDPNDPNEPPPYLSETSMFGWSVAMVGQYDKEADPPNYVEFVVGALLASNTLIADPQDDPGCLGTFEPQGGRSSGRVFVLHVDLVTFDIVVQALYFGEAGDEGGRSRLATSVGAGDFDGDGWMDIVAGASGYSPSASASEVGKLYFFLNPLAP